MDPQVGYNLLKMLTDEVPESAVCAFLDQSLTACQERNWERMSETAQNALIRARKQDDRVGEATALVHYGVANAQLGRIDVAVNSCKRAKRSFRREPDWCQRLGEGLAAIVLGLIDDRPVEAVRCFREALQLLSKVQECSAAEGNRSKQYRVQRVCEALRLKISGRTLIIYLNGEAHTLAPPAGSDLLLLELQPNVDYRVIPIEKDDYRALGLKPDDSVLVRRVQRVDDITPGLAVWYGGSGEFTVGRFERDDQGNVHFIQGSADQRLIGVSDVSSIGCVDAVLRPTWPLM